MNFEAISTTLSNFNISVSEDVIMGLDIKGPICNSNRFAYLEFHNRHFFLKVRGGDISASKMLTLNREVSEVIEVLAALMQVDPSIVAQ